MSARMLDVIRVLVVDDHSIVREGLHRVLDSPGFIVVGEASSGRQAREIAAAAKPDVIVLDISMKNGNGIESIPALLDASPDSRILMLSVHDGSEYRRQALDAGAHGYLLKDSAPQELRAAIRAVFEGDEPLGEHQEVPRQSDLSALTAREREVLALVATGRSTKEVAAELGISPRTVETHRDSIVRKLRVRHVAGLTRIAIENGLIV